MTSHRTAAEMCRYTSERPSFARRLGVCLASALLFAPPLMAHAATETLLHVFFGPVDGALPFGGVTLGRSGMIFGTTSIGGSLGYGTVYALTPSGVETVLAYFNGTDGSGAMAPPVPDPTDANVLLGTTEYGGAGFGSETAGNGILFAQSAIVPGIPRLLHGFSGGAGGAHPMARLVADAHGNLFGTTTDEKTRDGAVFELSATGHYKILHHFSGPDGDNPVGVLAIGPGGTLYGVTRFGGSSGFGTVFSLALTGSFATLYNFPAYVYPNGGLYRDRPGNLYGVTEVGGTYNDGILYRLAPAGTLTVLHSFGATGDGVDPTGAPIADAHGTLFGTTTYGGTVSDGTVFSFSRRAGETILYSFGSIFSDGVNPSLVGGSLAIDAGGNLYGATEYGGNGSNGTVFKITP